MKKAPFLTLMLSTVMFILCYGQINSIDKPRGKVAVKTDNAIGKNTQGPVDKTQSSSGTKQEGAINSKTSGSELVAQNPLAATSGTATMVVPSTSGEFIYVSRSTGSNKNDGSKSAPLKNLDKAIEMSKPGGTIYIAGGIETGTLNIGFIESDKPVKIYGSWDDNFEHQDIAAHPTVIQPDNESARSNRKALMKFTRDVAGTVIDHLVFDGGQRNAYHVKEGVIKGIEGGRLLSDTERPAEGFPTIYEPLLQFVSATTGGDVTIQNCVFVNGASFALQAGHRNGKFRVLNNVFVGNRMAAVEIYGTCASTGGPNTMALCGDVEIAYNTILFTWSRTKDFQDMGYGVRVMTKCSYNIHHNIIGASILAGVDHTRFNKDEWVKIDHNIFFVNKDKDVHYSPSSNTRLRIDAADLGDMEISSASGNKNHIPKELKVNTDYLEGYLNARYSEQTDFDRNSPSNQWRSMLGMNMQGTMTSSVTMFCNRYPWKEALNLFGNVQGYGVQ